MIAGSSRTRRPRPWLRVLRWAIAVLALVAAWGYGAWKGGNVLWLSIPVGVIVMMSTAAALTFPLVTAVLVTVAFIYGIDGGLTPALRNAAAAVVIVGLPVAGWRLAMRLRGRRR